MAAPKPVETIKKRADFLVAQAGEKAGTPSLLLIRGKAPNGLDRIRVGYTVTKKIGKAVIRNRIRRRLREAARQIFPDHGAAGFDYVLIARPAAQSRDFALLLDDMKRGLLRLAALPK
ncbi:MAG: ribonuclease P protein component [Alphaproteobacteria bacterium RIFCSPHIGHO2_12_FULL_63_12]|nr:MAG: ribonuclease P protein component [Alphaproteobacteria bacterium RIFCSPHIGHO2_12_FULL_63_12]